MRVVHGHNEGNGNTRVDEFELSNIMVRHRNLNVMARINFRLVPVAKVTVDLGVE